MKISERAKQQFFYVDLDYYTLSEIREMVDNGLIPEPQSTSPYLLPASECKSVKVICKGGFYYTVAVLHSGETIYITL